MFAFEYRSPEINKERLFELLKFSGIIQNGTFYHLGHNIWMFNMDDNKRV
jgi:hypothetical protein